MLEQFEQARRKLLSKYPGDFAFVREWQIVGNYGEQRRTGDELHLAKVLPDGTVTAVAIYKNMYSLRSPGVNGKPASYFNVLRYPNARASHRNGIVTYGFIQVAE